MFGDVQDVPITELQHERNFHIPLRFLISWPRDHFLPKHMSDSSPSSSDGGGFADGNHLNRCCLKGTLGVKEAVSFTPIGNPKERGRDFDYGRKTTLEIARHRKGRYPAEARSPRREALPPALLLLHPPSNNVRPYQAP